MISLLRGKEALLYLEGSLLEGKVRPLLFPSYNHIHQKGRCSLDITWSRDLLIRWLVSWLLRGLPPIPPPCYPAGLPEELHPGGGWKNTWVCQMHCRLLGGLGAGQQWWSGARLTPVVPFSTSFSAESRWLLPGSDLGPGVPAARGDWGQPGSPGSCAHQKPC